MSALAGAPAAPAADAPEHFGPAPEPTCGHGGPRAAGPPGWWGPWADGLLALALAALVALAGRALLAGPQPGWAAAAPAGLAPAGLTPEAPA